MIRLMAHSLTNLTDKSPILTLWRVVAWYEETSSCLPGWVGKLPVKCAPLQMTTLRFMVCNTLLAYSGISVLMLNTPRC